VDTGKHIVAAILREPDSLKRFIDAGFDLEWLTDKRDFSRADVLGDEGVDAYRFILEAFAKHRTVPTLEYFRNSYPPQAYRLPAEGPTTDELLDIAVTHRLRVQLEIAGAEFFDLHEAGKYADALAVMDAMSRKLRSTSQDGEVRVIWDGPDYDLEAKLDRQETPGVRTGIRELDDAFAGWQDCQLVTLLGRAKACKTSHLIKSALAAHEDGYNVLVCSVEIDADSIADRCDAFAAAVEHDTYIRGRLTDREKTKLRAAKSQRGRDGYFNIVQPTSKYTVADLEADIDRYNPGVVYIDGFYFMTDATTGKSGGNWEGHDNLAHDLKELALRRHVTIVVTMQIREKQAHGKGMFDDNSMMGGTGLLMASDMVLSLDMDKETWVNSIYCSRSRTRYLPSIRGQWHWKESKFNVLADEWGDPEDDNDE
jgi:DnaB helicase-like protein